MATETMAGTAEVLRENELDTTGLRRRVTSPGGSTARRAFVAQHLVGLIANEPTKQERCVLRTSEPDLRLDIVLKQNTRA